MSDGIWRFMSARTRRSVVFVWSALFVFSLGLQYLNLASPASVLAAVSDSGALNVEVADRNGYATGTTAAGALVDYIGDQSTTFGSAGTGVFNSFVRLQGDPREAGYNTDGAPLEFETKAGTWTHAIKVSEIPVVLVNGVRYWEFFADINDNNNTPRISLNDLEIYLTTNPDLTGYPFGAAATKVYDFSGSIHINDVNQGSGRGDLRYRIPVSGIDIPGDCGYLANNCGTYLVLYSEWGADSGTYTSDGGFEEWKVKKYPSLQIIKLTQGGDGTFDFTVAGPTSFTESVTTSNGVGGTGAYAVEPGTYAIAEGPLPPDWTFVGAQCQKNGGAPTDYVPGSNLVLSDGTPDEVVCVFTNKYTPPVGSLQVAKALTGGPQGYTGPFTINWDCDGTDHDGSTSVNAGDPAVLADGAIPTGTSCTVSEPSLPSVPGYSFDPPTFSPSATVTIESKDQVVTVTTNNTLTRDLAGLKLTKSLTGGPEGYTGPFTINYDCDGTAHDGSVELTAGTSQTIADIPTGTSCTVSEPTLPSVPGYTFGTPTFSPSATVTITQDATVEVTTNNTLTRDLSPVLTLDKSNDAPIETIDLGDGATIDLPTAGEGDTVTYTLDYTLVDGPVTEGVLTDVLPVGVEYVVGSAQGNAEFSFVSYDAATRTLLWEAATVTENGSVSYEVVVQDGAAELAQPLVNVAEISSTQTPPDGAESSVFVNPPPEALTPPPEAITPPPTDAFEAAPQGVSNVGFVLMLILLMLAGAAVLTGFLTPVPARARKSREDGR